MKKLIFFLCILSVSMFCFGQNEHFKFRDIEIKGKVTEFVNKLKSLGYTPLTVNANTHILKGSFIGKECEIHVHSTPISKTVYGVTVFFPKEKSWFLLKGTPNILFLTFKFSQRAEVR
jgi:hypothetical protein